MGVHSIDGRRGPRAARTRGALALAEPREGAPRRAPAGVLSPERAPEGVRPGRVRALPVAVPARRRPIHPTRGVSSAPPRDEDSPPEARLELWEDVAAWGQGAGAPARGRTPSRERAAGHPPRRQATTRAPRVGARVLPVASPPRFRTALLGSAVLAAAGLGALAGALTPAPFAAVTQSSAQAETVAVGAGQSLWTIAAAHTAPGADVRDTVEAIASANDLVGGQVRAGQVLVVPVDR